MLRIFNTLGKKLEAFRPVRPQRADVFTCGPSVYQRSHIGNFRTFLFEDILVRKQGGPPRGRHFRSFGTSEVGDIGCSLHQSSTSENWTSPFVRSYPYVDRTTCTQDCMSHSSPVEFCFSHHRHILRRLGARSTIALRT